jgi:hypothetical protein
MSADSIPIVATHRGVGIHEGQPRARIDGVVRPAIDLVFTMADAAELARYAADAGNPPEARLFAAARCEAAWQLAAEGRASRPAVDLLQVRASVAGLNSAGWMSQTHFCSLLDIADGAVPREPIARRRR